MWWSFLDFSFFLHIVFRPPVRLVANALILFVITVIDTVSHLRLWAIMFSSLSLQAWSAKWKREIFQRNSWRHRPAASTQPQPGSALACTASQSTHWTNWLILTVNGNHMAPHNTISTLHKSNNTKIQRFSIYFIYSKSEYFWKCNGKIMLDWRKRGFVRSFIYLFIVVPF